MEKFEVSKEAANFHSGAQQQLVALGAAEGREGARDDARGERMTTFLPVESKPGLPPNMRMHSRWDYLTEYFNFWKAGVLTKIAGITLLVLGFLALPVFAPGGLLMIAVGARFNDLAWWNNFIVNRFGKNRTLVLVD